MATLTNTQISVTYVGLLKTSANTVLSSTAQQITDGSGNNSILFLSTAGVGIGGAAASGKELDVTGNVQITGDLIIDNITIDGNTITSTTADFTIDASHDIILDAAGGDIILNDNTTTFGTFSSGGSSHLQIRSRINNADMFLRGVDDGVEFNALQLDMSDAGKAIFNAGASFADNVTLPDNKILILGAGSDLQLYHDGTNSFIKNFTGGLYIDQELDDGDTIFRSDNGSGGKTTYLVIDGGDEVVRFYKNAYLTDNIKALFGNSSDLQIYHDSTDSIIEQTQTGSGDLILRNANDDKDILFQSDDGSGGTSTYLFLDGSNTRLQFNTNLITGDNNKLVFGNSGDLEIYHDGSNSFVQDTGTGGLFLEGNGEVRIRKSATSEIMLQCVADGAVNLYHDNSKKLETTSTGISVTGTADISSQVLVGGNNSIFAENNLRFLSSGEAFIDHGTVGQSISFRVSNSSGLDTVALTLNSNGSATFGGEVNLGSNAIFSQFIKSNSSVRIDIDTDNNQTDRAFLVSKHNAGTELMRINEDGHIAFGTDAPNNFGFLEKAVHINAGTSSSTTLQQAGLVISGSSDSDDADDFVYVSFLNNHSALSNDRVAEIRVQKNGTDVDTGEFAFFTANGTSLNEAMRIDSSGNVGIGINPTKKLTVFGTGAGNATVQIEGEGGADPYINFLANNTQHFSLGIDDSDSDKFKLSKHSALGTNDYVVVDTSGNTTFAGDVSLGDSKTLNIGTGNDLQLIHDGSNSVITNLTGNLFIRNDENDADIVFQSDDGSGGRTEYFRIDGGAEKNIFSKPVELGDLTISGTLSGAGSFVPVGGGTFTGDVTVQGGIIPRYYNVNIDSAGGTSSNSNVYLLGRLTLSQSNGCIIKVLGTVSFGAGNNTSGVTYIHIRGNNSSTTLDGHFYGFNNDSTRNTIEQVRYVNISSNIFDIYIKYDGTFAGLDTVVETGGIFVPNLTDQGSTSFPTSVAFTSKFAATTAGIQRLAINDSGDATFAGGIDTEGNFINIGNGQGHSENYLQIGHSRTGNGFAYIDLVGDTTYTDFGLRIIRGNTGANATSTIEHKGTGNFSLKTTQAASLILQTSNTTALTLDTSQNATFAGAATFLSAVNVKAADNSDLPYINFSSNDGSFNWGRVGGLLQGDGDGALYFSTKKGGTTAEKMRLNSDGDVSIGTTSAEGKFTVVGANQTCNFDLDANAQVGLSVMGLSSNVCGLTIGKANATKQAAVFRFGFVGDGSDSNYAGIGLYAADDTLNVTGGGQVGVKTTAPASALEVVESTNYKGIHIRGSAAPNLTFGQNADTTAEWKLGISGFNGDSFSIGAGTGADDKLHITSTGLTGINTTAPTGQLHSVANSSTTVPLKLRQHASTTVESILSITNKASGTDFYHFVGQTDAATSAVNRIIIYGNGNIQNSNNSYGQISDENLKENIVDATPKLEDIKKLKVKNFNYKGEDYKQIGMIAQDVEKIFPSLVEEVTDPETKEKHKSLKYSVFVPMLIKSIQELEKRVQELENK